ELKDGRTLPCDMFLAAVGIRPNIGLARDAGIPVGRGVLVDDRMRTGVPRVFGLWPIATEQAQTAAVNALGGDARLTAETPATILKGVGLELFSIGQVEAGPFDVAIVVDAPAVPSYRRMVLSGGRAVGATILGHHPSDLAAARNAVRERMPVSAAAQQALRSGNWSVLAESRTPTG